MIPEPSRSQEKLLILKRVPFFASCTEEQLHLIADRTRLVEYKKGEDVYREGDPAEAFYILGSGRVRVFSRAGEEERTFAILHNGDSFGEISLLTGETHSANVQALNDTLILRLDKQDFDDVINRIPSLVLYLSRLLSKRLRTKQSGGEFSEATIVAVSGAVRGVGCTVFAAALAAMLARETGHRVVVVDLGASETNQRWLSGVAGSRVALREVLQDTSLDELQEVSVATHTLGFSVIAARELISGAGGEHLIAPLLNSLTNGFHYVIIDLPAELSPPVLKTLVQADLLYLLTDAERDHLVRTNALIHQLRSTIGTLEHRMKVVLNLVARPEEPLSASSAAQHLGHPVAFTLPHAASLEGEVGVESLIRLVGDRTVSYALAVRRVARELGGLLVGLALGSGAALGLAHIGVLKVIEREEIPIDLVSGSSIGALIGGLWASGRSAEELERMALRFKSPWDVRKLFIFDVGVPRISMIIGLVAGVLMGSFAGPWAGVLFGLMTSVTFGLALGPLVGGPIQGARLMAKLQEDFAGKTFEETWVPLKIVAANPMAREEVVFDSGPLIDAVRASVSIPGIFKPVTHQGKVCLDGGVVSPVPVGILKRSGARHIIAVNVFPTTPELTANLQEAARRRAEREAQVLSRGLWARVLWGVRQELLRSVSPLVFDVIMRSMQSMEHQIAEVACREADITLRPTVAGSHWLEFFSPEKFIERGEAVALQCLPELKRITRMRNVDSPPQAG